MWVMSICTKISHVIFFPLLVVISTMWYQGHHRSFRISSGILRGTRAAAPHIWAFPLHVPDHCVWKPAHHPGRQLRLPPPHPHVLLPLQPVLCKRLLHLHHHPKDAMEHPDTEQSYHLWMLRHPDVLFHTVCRVGWLPPDCDGLWPLCGSATTSTTQSSWILIEGTWSKG